jgi:uncharacterized protein YndB with AHSA1/START domain
MAEPVKAQIRKSIFICAPPEKIFEVITDARHWDKYFTTGMELDPRPGGVCDFKWRDWGPDRYDGVSPGKVLEIEEPNLFAFEWGSQEKKTTARLKIEPKYEGTVLTLEENGYPETEEGREYLVECAAHWGELLTLIKFYVEFGVTYRSPSVGRD